MDGWMDGERADTKIDESSGTTETNIRWMGNTEAARGKRDR